MGEERYYLGVDPSTVSTGYGIINSKARLIEYGVITPPAELEHEHKLLYQLKAANEIIDKYNNLIIGCEDQFGGPNMDTLKKIARTTATIMIAASQRDIDLHMFYPSSWRLLFHGSGKVKKTDTLKLVNETHGLSLKRKDNDIADAIGVAHATLIKCLGGCEQSKK